MDRLPLTKRQNDLLEAIREALDGADVGPTLDELAERLKINKATVLEHIRELQRKGWVTSERYQSRSIRLARDAGAAAARSGSLPLLGTIAAGHPIEAVECPEQIDLAEAFSGQSSCYALRVRGDSMIDDHICDGDVIVVRPTKTPSDGSIVVALVDGTDATVKRIYRRDDQIVLAPRNEAMKPMTFHASRIQIRGIVIGVIRGCGPATPR